MRQIITTKNDHRADEMNLAEQNESRYKRYAMKYIKVKMETVTKMNDKQYQKIIERHRKKTIDRENPPKNATYSFQIPEKV